VNSEHVDFRSIAEAEGVNFHQRPEALGSDTATSEDFIGEFLQAHPCTWIVQVHSIAPLVSVSEVRAFVDRLAQDDVDVLLSCEHLQIECALDGVPVNFSQTAKTNSQALRPVQRISWSLTAWRRETFLQATTEGRCATWAGRIGYQSLSPMAAHVVKTEQDLQIAQALLGLAESANGPTC
jgi:CMP-N-acetylneuraminic acid synthetase